MHYFDNKNSFLSIQITYHHYNNITNDFGTILQRNIKLTVLCPLNEFSRESLPAHFHLRKRKGWAGAQRVPTHTNKEDGEGGEREKRGDREIGDRERGKTRGVCVCVAWHWEVVRRPDFCSSDHLKYYPEWTENTSRLISGDAKRLLI